MQQPTKVMKPHVNQVQETYSKDKAEDKAKAVVEEGEFTKDVDDEVGDSTTHHTCPQFGNSREK